MDINDIVLEIKNQLSGVANQDINTIIKISRDHHISVGSPEFKQILEKLTFKNSLENIATEENEEILRKIILDTLDNVVTLINQKEKDQAYNIMIFLVKTIEEREIDADSLEADEKIFHEPMEHLIYTHLKGELKDYQSPKYPLDQIYYLYGLLLKDSGEYEKAIKAFEKSLKFAPILESVLLEEAQTYRYAGDLDKSLEKNIYILNNGFNPNSLVRAYYNIASIFNEKGLYKEAVITLEIAKFYESDLEEPRNLYEYILKENGSIPEPPPFPVAQELLSKYNVPVAAAIFPAKIALDVAQLSEERGQYEPAHYFYKIYNKINHEENVDKKIKELEEKLSEF